MKLIALAMAMLCSTLSWASTGFHIGSGVTKNMPNIYAISTGWYYPVQAAATANPRNVQKTGELFGQPGNELKWISKYGSVSQTINGLEFPMSGLNDQGLTIQATVLVKETYPAVPKDGFGLFFLQWIQYHLDTSATVGEVISKSVTLNAPVLPTGMVDIQFQACDPWHCAVISFYGTKAVAQGSMGKVTVDFAAQTVTVNPQAFPISAIANYTYENNIAVFNQCKESPCTNKDNVYDRFNKAAEAVLSFAGAKSGDVEYVLANVFEKLKSMDQGLPMTTWNEAYFFQPKTIQPRQMLLIYKTPSLPVTDRQWIDFSSEKFDCTQPANMWWLDMSHAGGDQTAAVFTHSRAVQEKLTRQHSSMLNEAMMMAMIEYPAAKTSCIH